MIHDSQIEDFNIDMKRRYFIIISSIITICIISCVAYYLSMQANATLQNRLIEMHGKTINLSFDETEVFYNGNDTTYSNSKVKKLVMFVDSASCSGCFINKLVQYYNINEHLNQKDGQLVIVFNPPQNKIEEIRRKIIRKELPFWCVLDKTGDFLLKNPIIPDNELLHSFTLDENDNIILVGDPLSNPDIMDLFLKQINQQS